MICVLVVAVRRRLGVRGPAAARRAVRRGRPQAVRRRRRPAGRRDRRAGPGGGRRPRCAWPRRRGGRAPASAPGAPGRGGLRRHRRAPTRAGCGHTGSASRRWWPTPSSTASATRSPPRTTTRCPAPLEQTPIGDPPAPIERGRVVVVWGPQGAPGRTTVATGLAGALAERGLGTVLVDADPYGGAVGQQLGVLDEVSGLLSAARLASSGLLAERLSTVPRGLGPHLSVVTGLPRPGPVDRGPARGRRAPGRGPARDVPRGRRHRLLPRGGPRHRLRQPPGSQRHDPRRARRSPTRWSSSAPPTRWASRGWPARWWTCATCSAARRYASWSTGPGPALGWSEREVAGMVEGFARVSGVHFLPDDRAAATGRWSPAGPWPRAGTRRSPARLAALAAAVVPAPRPSATARPGRLRRRTAGRARRR